MPLNQIGPMQTQFGTNLAQLGTQNAQFEQGMRQQQLENFKQRMWELMQIEEQKKMQKTAARKKQQQMIMQAGIMLATSGLGLVGSPAVVGGTTMVEGITSGGLGGLGAGTRGIGMGGMPMLPVM